VSLDKALSEIMKQVPECIAAGWVDMNTGMLLGVKTVDSHPQEVLDLVAAATTDLFQGANVTAIEQLFKKSRGVADNGQHYFKEIVVLSENLIHVFSRGKKKGDQVLVAVTRVSANLGMVLAKVRNALPAVEAVG
jgi:predicted regulator of Ras-like GTPase activity (Roadblock/LC7/MglB family)